MITFLQPLPVGNAVRVLLDPPAGADRVKVLRHTSDDFPSHDAPGRAVVYEGEEAAFVDVNQLRNGTTYFYAPFYRVDGVWEADETASAVPLAAGAPLGPDPQSIIRDRLNAAMKVALVEERITHDNTSVPCLTAAPTYEGTTFPIVTVHLDNAAVEVRGLGEIVLPDRADGDEWVEAEGGLVRHKLKVVSWIVNNGDVRLAYRRAIEAALIGNLPVFEAMGLSQFQFDMTDTEDMESYGSPMFQTITSISCLAPAVFVSRQGSVADVHVQVT